MNELRVTENSWSSHLQLPNAGNSGMPCPVQYDTCFFVTLLLLIIDKVKSETKASSSRLGSPEGNVIMWTYLVGSAWAWMTLSILLSLYPTMWWVSNTGFSLLAATFSMKPLIIFISATVIKQPDKKKSSEKRKGLFYLTIPGQHKSITVGRQGWHWKQHVQPRAEMQEYTAT